MSIIFSIDKSNENRTVYRIFGIKISLYNDKNLLEYILSPFKDIIKSFKIKSFLHNHNKYLKRKNTSVKRRIIMTSGNISLVNAIAALNQNKTDETNYEDYLYVWSVNKNPEFRKACEIIASQHNFKNIFYFEDFLDKQLFTFSQHYHNNWLIEDFLARHLYEFDEIYTVNIIQYIKLLETLFPNDKYYMIDESAFGRFSKGDYKNILKFIMTNYFNKIDYIGFPDAQKAKFEDLNKKNFIEVADKCASLDPFDIDIKTEDKPIIICGTWGGFNKYNTQEVVDMQMELVKEFQQKGYSVLFKPHPRDIYPYERSENLTLLRTRLPLECYELKDILTVISIRSFSSMQVYHYRDISGFISMNDLNYDNEITMKFIEEYTPSVDLIRNINPNDYDFQNLKQHMLSIHAKFLESKPLLSQNQILIKLYDKQIKERK